MSSPSPSATRTWSPAATSRNSHHLSSPTRRAADPTPFLQDDSPRFTEDFSVEEFGLNADFGYTMPSPHGSTHSSFGHENSGYNAPPADSMLLNGGHMSPTSPSFQTDFHFNESPIDTRFIDDTHYSHGPLSRLNIPRISIPSPNINQFESPSYMQPPLTASPSPSGNSNNSPFTPSYLTSLSSPGTLPYLPAPPTPSAVSPHISHGNMDFLQYSPVSPGYAGLGLYNMPKSQPMYSYVPPSSLTVPQYMTAELHSFPHSDTAGASAMGSKPSHPSVLELAQGYHAIGVVLPQRKYRPHTQSDRKRYVEDADLEQPIMFFMQNPETCGIPCRDALTNKFMRLVGRDDQVFIKRGPSVSLRFEWPGYAPWSRQIPTKDFKTPPQPITRSKLAKNVAKTVARLLSDLESRPLEAEADSRWRVGVGRITIDDLDIIGLQHVSMGSWQVHLRVRNRQPEFYQDRADYRAHRTGQA
ncbi:hypothetical protein EUX98_g5612 [Antrodiella citrinella]|uniref:Uncharacterized protein n=1 Tax=Antrodiella citrinella TaxID=2447956 RepID=A0A4S4MTW5_9APHY|nr:hypothetical protein EUX98_g5612 [Antrodiella citrinella]